MKKRALERIPLREAPEDCEASAWMEMVQGTEYLIIDIPEEYLRIALTEKEYANYRFPEVEGQEGRWSEENIENTGIKWPVIMDAEEEAAVIRWYRHHWKRAWHNPQTWFDALQAAEQEIRSEKRRRVDQRRRERLEERCAAMPAIPERFVEWTESCFGPTVLFYHRTNKRHARVFCCACGKTAEYAFRKLMTPRGQLERLWEEPERGKQGTCSRCGAKGIYRSDKAEGVYGTRGRAYLIQKFQDGIVLRKFLCERHSRFGSKDNYVQYEEGRAFYLPGKMLLDYRYTDNWTGETSWYDHNIPGLAQIIWERGTIWPGSFMELKGTEYQYSGLEKYYEWHNMIDVKKYLDRYRQIPALEMLVKMNARNLVENILVHGADLIDPNGRSAASVLRLSPQEAKRFLQENGSDRQLRLMQMEERNGWRIDNRTEKELLRSGIEIHRIAIALRFMSARKLLNHLMKYVGANDLLSISAVERVKNVSVTYTEYLAMRAGLGYDMTDSIGLFPRDLHTAHHEMTVQSDRQKSSTEIQKKEIEYGERIRGRFDQAVKSYYWEDEGKLIRPAASASEIIMEGRELHHCVGGDPYLSAHADGRSTILFLRRKEKPEVPYVTVEIKNRKINQWYGAYDKKPDKEENEEWLNKYMKTLLRRAV